MREILFRGIRKDTHEWVYGFYGEYFNGKKNVPCISVGDTHVITGALCYEVITETVGQYTGLKDKNSKRIFEGSIIKLPAKSSCDDEIYSIAFDDECAMFCCLPFIDRAGIIGANFLCFNGADVEVIGNIHDDPDLMQKLTE